MKHFIFYLSVLLLFQACTKDDDDTSPANSIPDQSFSESFDTASAAVKKGWIFLNKSVEPGTTFWSNPSPAPFTAFSSQNGSAGYLWADFNSTSSESGIISNWAISPVLTMQNGDKISFYTRAELYYFENDSTDFVNRLQVRLNIKDTSSNTGNGRDAGNFTVLLLDINADYLPFFYTPFMNHDPESRMAYPHRWTRFEAIVSGLDRPREARFALRYYVEEAGNNGRSSSIGVDELRYQSIP